MHVKDASGFEYLCGDNDGECWEAKSQHTSGRMIRMFQKVVQAQVWLNRMNMSEDDPNAGLAKRWIVTNGGTIDSTKDVADLDYLAGPAR